MGVDRAISDMHNNCMSRCEELLTQLQVYSILVPFVYVGPDEMVSCTGLLIRDDLLIRLLNSALKSSDHGMLKSTGHGMLKSTQVAK